MQKVTYLDNPWFPHHRRAAPDFACACARCVDEWSGAATLDPSTVPADVHPLQIRNVGRYAIQIDWSDGHDSGIYPFRRLRELSGR